MDDDDDLHNLPDDTDLAFATIEKFARTRLNAALSYAEDPSRDVDTYDDHLLYMTTVLGAAKVYEITDLDGWRLPCSTERQENWATVQNFRADAQFAAIQRKLRAFERTRANFVKLPPAGKARLQQMIVEMRKTVEKLHVPDARKRRLFARINKLQAEVDRDRTNMEVISGIFLEAIGTGGEGAKRAEPVLEAIERIGNVINGYKAEEEEQKRLPRSEEPKRLPKPEPNRKKDKNNTPSFDREVDDEIPF